MASESESSASESEWRGRDVEAPIACGSGCFLPLLEEDIVQVRGGAVEKTRDVHGTIVFGEWWWCVFVYMMYMGWFWMLAISSGRCGSVIVTAWNIPRSSLGNA